MYDLVIEGRALIAGELVDSYLCIESGRISRICRSDPGKGSMGELHRMGRKIILPGVVDSHVHMRDPGFEHKEDLTTGSISAAFGGVASFIDMPNNRPPTFNVRALRQKEEAASRKCVVDFGFNLGLMSSSDPSDIEAALRGSKGAPPPSALKAFMGETTGSLVFGPFEELRRWSGFIARNGMVLCIHAEDGNLFGSREEGRPGRVARDHADSRPAEAESSAVRRSLTAMEGFEEHLHVLHISSELGLKEVEKSKATVEVTPHHLLLDIKWAERNLENQALAKVNPPVRTPSERAALWRGIEEGKVHTIGSDHAPHTSEEKSQGLSSPSGIPGVETMLPLLLAQVNTRRVGLQTMVRLLSENPSSRFGLTGRGRIQEGFFADLIAVDLKDEREVDEERLHSKCGWSPYNGFKAVFPSRVYSRGDLVVEDESLCCSPGRGRNLRG
ncbi:MAG: dihydroorotase [Thermoplasmatota archaeon]